ncbi:formin-like protein 1 [Carassius gibelio]|uniref:formin-like protein 1 n=1 Tax=Carassius gibelio TaxID=101364 RepID=UPI002278A151|nr:formin-like protein 1 [Carassius gibelio]XP_052398070.1 formin-like protein 1 [Carassius gibelio]XP_052398071.1 formin-like protein 1 [Carassius gibelio]XP_052398072.1 formin-like protein 1 [Carassius gibelio]
MGNAAGSLEMSPGRDVKQPLSTYGQKQPPAPKLPLPPEEELEERFNIVLNSMNLPADKVKLLCQYDNEKKWELVCDQERFQVKNPPSAYIQKLKSVLEQGGGRKFKRRVQESTQVLRELEISLRTNHIGWAEEFLNEENKGLDMLVDYLSFVQRAVTYDMDSSDNGNVDEKSVEDLTTSATNSPTHNSSRLGHTFTTRKSLRYSCLLSQKNHLHLCIMCLRAIMNYQLGFNQVMSHPSCVNEITLNLNNKSARTKALVLELLAAVCLVRGGHEMIIAAFNNFKEVCGEKVRFEKLMEYFRNEDNNIDFMVACLQFINIVVHSVENMNFRVYLQYEFTQLGLDSYLEKLNDTESERLEVQIQAYLDNVFDVGAMLEDVEAKNTIIEHLEELQEQNTQLNTRLQQCEREAVEKTSELEKQLIQSRKEVELLKDSVKETQAQLSQLQQKEKERETHREKEQERERERQRTAKALTELEKMVQVLVDRGLIRMERSQSGSLDLHIMPAADTTDNSITDIKASPVTQSPPPPPAPAPPPPPPPPPMSPAPPSSSLPGRKATVKTGVKSKKPIKTKYRMPLLNWQALMEEQVAGTVFTELDDESVLGELNMDVFEELFKTKAQSAPVDVGTLKVKVARKTSSKITILEPNRAKNLAITLRKGGMSTAQICTAIQTFNLDLLKSDFLELLERFIPSDYELSLIEKYEREGHALPELSEEDRFIVTFSKIPCLPQRISNLTFMGNFSESIQLLKPQLNAIIAASMSIKSSSKLKKILEIILAFGNYMNSGKRGSAYGFRVQSLDLLLDMKSTDRKLTLLHFIASIIQEKYPQLHNFHTELHCLDKAALVSLDSILADVGSLEKGMEVVRKEFLQQKDSTVLTNFMSSNGSLLDSLVKDCKTAEEVYHSVVEYFGEEPKSTPPSVFFPVFDRFIKAYKLAEQENEQRKKKSSETDSGTDLPVSDPPMRKAVTNKMPQVDLIAELKRRQMKPLVREGKDGAIEDIITDLRNQPYIRADGGRRSAKWKPAQQLPVSSDISL